MASEPKASELVNKVLSSRQLLLCSRKTPRLRPGIITKEKRAVWKTVPDNMLLRLRLSPHALKEFTDNADATDFIFSRI